MTTVNETKPKTLSISNMAIIAIMTALTCILAPLSIAIPVSPVPISLTNLVIYFSLYLLGAKRATISYLVYLLLGMVGIPVFSGYTGGLQKLAGPTGGYIIGFIFMAIIAGIFIEKFSKNVVLQLIGMILGTAVCYAFGTVWLAHVASLNFKAALFAGVIPYLPGDFIKMLLALTIGATIRNQLKKAGLI